LASLVNDGTCENAALVPKTMWIGLDMVDTQVLSFEAGEEMWLRKSTPPPSSLAFIPSSLPQRLRGHLGAIGLLKRVPCVSASHPC
jgi:hypothetical protein